MNISNAFKQFKFVIELYTMVKEARKLNVDLLERRVGL